MIAEPNIPCLISTLLSLEGYEILQDFSLGARRENVGKKKKEYEMEGPW
jgi:hypothetical protein